MRFAFPFAAFFLSGASSLVFQTIWTRLLHHVFGSTSVAMSSVLTVFMAGLGLGAWIGGRYVDRIKRPLLIYAIAEAGVAVCALVIPLLVQPDGWLAGVNSSLRESLGADSAGFALVRFLCVVPILIIPTTLMGATLPLLARHFIPRGEEGATASARAGTLYAINTAGAVLGTFIGGFVLLPKVGLNAANFFAVGLNVVLALTIGSLGLRRLTAGSDAERVSRNARRVAARTAAKKAGPPDHERDLPPPIDANEPFMRTGAARTLALFAFAASGAAALCYEVVWSRALAMVLGSSIYSFTLILMTFLIGIAAGSAYVSACFTPRAPRWGTAVAAIGLCLLAHARVGVVHSVFHYVVLVAACAAVIVALELALRRRLGARVNALVMLAVPLLSALVQVFIGESDLPKIALTVVISVSAFLLAPLWLGRRPLVLLGATQLFIAVATFLSYVWQDTIPATFASLVSSLDNLPERVGTVQFFMFLTASLCTLPATLGMGAMFPLALRLFSKSGENIGRDVGTVYTANTLGSILGAWLPGFVLLPLVGMERTLHLGIMLNFAVGAGLVAIALWKTPARPRGAAFGALAALAMVPLAGGALYAATAEPDSPLRWNQSQMTLGAFRVSRAKELSELPKDTERPKLEYYRDGLSTTVTIELVEGYHSLKVNGKVDASDVPGGDMYTQVALAAYPMLLHPRPPAELDVAIIGFGSGVTVGTALKLGAKLVHAIELEPAVLEASRYFHKANGLTYAPAMPYASAPGLTIFMDDGRNYLASAKRDYDLIISEPSNPWIAGVSDLFTTEHFRISKRRLKKGGIYVQWVQLYEVSPENIKSIYRTFASQFAHVRVLASASFFDDTLLLGSDEPLPLDYSELKKRMGAPGVMTLMKETDAEMAGDLLARQILGSRAEVLAFTQIEEEQRGKKLIVKNDTSNGRAPRPGIKRIPVPLNTDDNARIEFAAPRDLIGYERYAGYTSQLYAQEWPWGRYAAIPGVPEGDAGAVAYAELALAFIGHLRTEEALRFLEKSEKLGQARETAVATLVVDLMTAEEETDPSFNVTSSDGDKPLDEAQIKEFQELLDETETAAKTKTGFAALAERAETWLTKDSPLNAAPLRFLHAYLLYCAAESEDPPYEPAIEALLKVATDDAAYAAKQPSVYYFLGRAYQRTESYPAAARWLRKYVETAGALGVLVQPPEAAATADVPPEETPEDPGAEPAAETPAAEPAAEPAAKPDAGAGAE